MLLFGAHSVLRIRLKSFCAPVRVKTRSLAATPLSAGYNRKNEHGATIAAASPEGTRYHAKMTSAKRSSGANGIWLCQSCSKLIDSDKDRYTVGLLHQWKKDAIQQRQARANAGAHSAAGEMRRSPPTLDSVARLTALAEPVSIAAPGGTGKSTTVVQLAERMLAEGDRVAVLCHLASGRTGKTIFRFHPAAQRFGSLQATTFDAAGASR